MKARCRLIPPKVFVHDKSNTKDLQAAIASCLEPILIILAYTLSVEDLLTAGSDKYCGAGGERLV